MPRSKKEQPTPAELNILRVLWPLGPSRLSAICEALGRIQEISRESGMTVLVVEQKVREVLKIARRVYVLRNGQVSFTGMAEELKNDAKLKEVYL